MSGWTVAWIMWLGMAAAIEGPALFNKTRGDTLTEHLIAWFSIKDKARQWRIRRALLALFLFWLAVHLISGGQYF
jgi:hypothetical protein